MKKIAIIIFLSIFIYSFSIPIYFNTFDNSLIIEKKVYQFGGKALPYSGKIITYFKSPEIPNTDLPSNLLVLEDGQTIGLNGTIKVSKEVFEKILELYNSNKIDKIIIDYFPIEIYNDKIVVKELTPREKVFSYIKIFKNNFELVETQYYLGEYDISFDKPKINITTFIFPNCGYYHVNVSDKSAVYTKIYVNGKLSTKNNTLPSGNYKLFVESVDELGFQSTSTILLNIPKSKTTFQQLTTEYGTITNFGTINFVGTRNFYDITPEIATITTITSKDTTPPEITISAKKLFGNYYYITLNSNDKNKTKTILKLNDKQIKCGINKLSKGKNIISVYSEDTFKNCNLKHITIYNYENLESTLTFFNEKRWINIGGILIKSPFIKSWINPNIKRRIYEDKKYIINIK